MNPGRKETEETRHSTGAACMRMQRNPEHSVTLNGTFTLPRISTESNSWALNDLLFPVLVI